MNKYLFEIDYKHDPEWVVKSYFNRMYRDHHFLEAIELLSKKWSLNADGAYCHFPDMESPDESEHFEGVEFEWGPSSMKESVIVSEQTCYDYVRLSSQLYVQKHPEDTDKVNQILASLPL